MDQTSLLQNPQVMSQEIACEPRQVAQFGEGEIAYGQVIDDEQALFVAEGGVGNGSLLPIHHSDVIDSTYIEQLALLSWSSAVEH